MASIITPDAGILCDTGAVRALAPLAVVMAAALLAGGASATRPKPGVRIAVELPLTVVGSSFQAGELVRVEAAGRFGTRTARVRATAAGRFRVRFAGVSGDACSLRRIDASGAKGSRAFVRLIPGVCPAE